MYDGYYINLRASEDRREALTAHLTEIGAQDRYRRFEAVDGHVAVANHPTPLLPGELGCWLSHEGLLGELRDSPRHVHIIEDDVVLTSDAVRAHEELVDQADSRLGAWDLLLTEAWLPLDPAMHRTITAALLQSRPTLVHLGRIPFAGMTSYIVNRASIAKLTDHIAGGWVTGPPLDLRVRDLVNQGLLHAYAAIPFLASLARSGLTRSDARGTVPDRTRQVFFTYRRALFRDADHGALRAEMEDLVEGSTLSPLDSIYVAAIAFSLCKESRAF